MLSKDRSSNVPSSWGIPGSGDAVGPRSSSGLSDIISLMFFSRSGYSVCCKLMRIKSSG